MLVARLSLKGIVVLTVVSLLLLGALLAFGSTLSGTGEIAFTLEHAGARQIFVLDVQRQISVSLTKHASNNSVPIWSPDGGKIAFVSDRTNNAEIYVMRADGSDIRNLTKHQAADAAPAWSPDSTTLAFLSQRDGLIRVYLVKAEGGDLQPVSDKTAYTLAWSPDGSRLAFAAIYSYYIYDFNAQQLHEIEGDFLSVGQLLWLPDNQHLMFTSSRAGQAEGGAFMSSVVMVNADGSGLRRFFDIGENESWLALSPDGGQLVLLTECLSRGCEAMYVMRSDGSRPRQIAIPCPSLQQMALFAPTWSADGSEIAFASNCSGGFDLYSVRLATGEVRRLTFYHSGDNMFPAWRPA